MAKSAAAEPTTVFTWKISQLERQTADGFVFVSHWAVDAKSGDVVYSSGAYGSVGFERPENLIPFADLSEDEVIGWTKQALGGDEKVAEIENALQKQLDEQRAPSVANGVPWS